MRKLLQNKLVVSALAVVAVLCIAANFVKLPRFSSFSVAARETQIPVAPPPIEAKYHIHGPAFVHLSNQPWRELFPIDLQARDPFAPPVLPAPATIPEPRRADPTLPPQLTLQGVSIEAGRALAVINQSILAEGETIAGCRVERILPQRVTLSGPFGPLVLDMNAPARAKKHPIAKPANADLPAELKPSEAVLKKQ